MKKVFAFMGLSIILSCNSPKEIKTDVDALSQYVVGLYEASLPCADCISIEYQLELKSDSSCIEHITYLGKVDGNYEVHGRWVADVDSIIALNQGRLAYKIKVNPNGSLNIVDAIENHLEKQPAVITRIGTSETDQSVLLNDIWVLEAIDNIEVTDSNYLGERPQLEFNKVDGKVTGTTGCNRLEGVYTTNGNNLAFSALLSTKMACPGKREPQLIQALNEVSFFKIVSLRLYLFSGSTEKLRLKKAD